jgi:hypothetical protein
MSNQNNTLPRSLSNQNNKSLRLPPQKKPYNNKPITLIKIVNGNQIIKQNEIINTDPDDLLSVDWTLITSPHSQKRHSIIYYVSQNQIKQYIKPVHIKKSYRLTF